MLFNSSEFLVFLAGFLVFYWLVRRWLLARNILIVVASYFFYCWWDYRFGALLLFTTLVDFFVAGLIADSPSVRRRKLFLVVSMVSNLGVLGFFKYYDFFAESFEALLATFGFKVSRFVLNITLPVGISFYTFQSMAYTIDVYRGKVPATRNLIQFLAFVSFFPQLVAGPIERAERLLPQFNRTLHITTENLERGLWLIVWGLFQKVVLADNLAPLADLVFDHAEPSLPVLALGAVAFGLQIFCGFAGYSNVARGVAKLLGFDLMINFNAPYVAQSIQEFWRRWHISLSTWIRDYLYIPLGGNRLGEARTCWNVLLVMLLAGLWHGADLNFILWGLWHGSGLVVSRLWGNFRHGRGPLPAWLGWSLTLWFVFAGWVLFRVHSVDRMLELAHGLTSLALPVWWGTFLLSVVVLAIPVVVMHLWQLRTRQAEAFPTLSRFSRAALQAFMLLALLAWWKKEASPFIYFQF